MSHQHNEFEALARRVRQGDASAAPEMRRLLEGAVGTVARRALRGGGTSELDRHVRAAALRVVGGADDPARLAGAAELTAASLAARVVGRLRAGADSVPGYQTVVA